MYDHPSVAAIVKAPHQAREVDIRRHESREEARITKDGLLLAEAFVDHSASSLFSSPAWLAALEATYGFKIKQSGPAAPETGLPSGVLFCEVSDLRGERIVSLPFSDYCDPFIANIDEWKRAVDPIIALGRPTRFRVLHSSAPLSDGRFTRTAKALWHATDLSRPPDEVYAGLSGSARQNIRKAERSGVRIRRGGSLADLRAFYDMHRSVRRQKYGLFAQPFAFFENLHASFAPTDDLIVLLAELDGQAIAGILFLVHGDTLYYKFNASVSLAVRPNDLLVWNGMRVGQERGLANLDFGLSDTDQPGLVHFKRKFATFEHPITELHWSPPNYRDQRGAEMGVLLRDLTSILTAPGVADAVTSEVGDRIYRLFC